jgi:hypothetical protein
MKTFTTLCTGNKQKKKCNYAKIDKEILNKPLWATAYKGEYIKPREVLTIYCNKKNKTINKIVSQCIYYQNCTLGV